VATGSERPGYEIEVTRASERTLDRIAKADRKAFARLDEAILGLAEDPRHHRVEKLAGQENLYRVRSGDFRVVFSIDDERRIVTIEAIGNRRDIYRDL
jgi:mRNA interferase RelE/StbE